MTLFHYSMRVRVHIEHEASASDDEETLGIMKFSSKLLEATAGFKDRFAFHLKISF